MSPSSPIVQKFPELAQGGQKKLFIKTYGCQMNVYDTTKIKDILQPFRYTPCESPEEADLIILNTCHIREKAEEKVFSDLGRYKRFKKGRPIDNPLFIIVAGCVGQAEGPIILKRAPYVDGVIGPQTYHRLPEVLGRILRSYSKNVPELQAKKGFGILATGFPKHSKFDFLPEEFLPSGPTAFLSIQEGCDKFCRYCVVPYTRGAEFSRPAKDVVEEAKKLVVAGAKEITLLGQNVNAYHGLCQDPGSAEPKPIGLGRLIHLLKEKVPEIRRWRYTTSHPRDVDEELIQAHGAIPELMPFLHLPVQSGSDKVLEAMNRKHTIQRYLDILKDLRASRPDIRFSSDFIVGYPGETEEDFEATCHLVATVVFDQGYSFKYSPRPGTPGALLPQIPEEVKDRRLQVLQSLLREQQQAFNRSCVGSTVEVLFERPGREPHQWTGKTPYMQAVAVPSYENLAGKIGKVAIEESKAFSLKGSLVDIES